TSTQPIVLGEASDAATLGLQSGDLDSITAGMVQVGYRAEDGTSSFTGDITIGGNAGITLSTANFPTLLLVTGGAGTIAQSEPISFPNGTLGAIADGNIALASGNSVGTVAGFTDGGLLDFANGEALTVGSLTLPTLGVAVDADGLATAAIIPNGNGLPSSPLSGATASGPLVIGTTGDLTLAANVTADGQMVTLGASNGSINQTAGIITAGTLNAAGSDNVALNDSNDITTLATGAAQGSFSLNNGTDLTISGSVAGLTSTTISAAGTLTVNGTVISNGGRVGLSGSSIDIAGGGEVSDGGTGTTTLTATDGTINETGTLLAGTLGGSATGAATLTGASPFSNQIATLASFSASNLTLTDGTALTIAGPVTADFLNITATGRMVLAGTINTTGASLLQQSGPSPAPQGSTLQVVDSPLDPSAGAQFIQTGTVTLGDPPATTLRVQLPASGGSATFNDLLGSGAELVLALGNGTATGAMQVGGLLVIGQGGSTTLTGSIDGVITGAAAALGQISPAVNASYTFNGCIIGLATCGLPPGTSPGTPGGTTPPTRESLSFLQLTAVLGGLIDFLPGPRLPPLPTLPKLNVVLLPTLPVIGNQLAPQDVVPPNISFEDY
ncbi:MAG TPA: hypothetical protein VMB34_09095, partial [Acetobacteraceae bacterium]|nr:hypothetical protein [Acetobacteraceae bacterium]